MRISVVVPSYRRPDNLQACLRALQAQIRPPEQVLVATREGDEESQRVLANWIQWPVLKVLTTCGRGAVAQYNCGLEASNADIIAMTDDDSVPRPDWLSRIEKWFRENDDLGGVGGRDTIHQDGTTLPGAARKVGVVQWFGRIVDNHHLGTCLRPNIDVLKGVNMSFRASAIDGLRFDTDLRGRGAQVCLDMAFTFAVRKRGWRVLFDPDVVVDHFPARRFDADQRHAPSLEAVEDSSYNLYLALRRHLRHGLRQKTALLWAHWIGTRRSPGRIRGLLCLMTGNRAGKEFREAASRAWVNAKRDCQGA